MTERAHPAPAAPRITTILVPFDFGDAALRALGYARLLAERLGASFELLHVVPNPYVPHSYLPINPDLPLALQLPGGFVDELMQDAEGRLQAALPRADAEAGRARTWVAVGDPRAEILERASTEQVDLIVMGTHGRRGASHFLLGSVAERIVRAAPCPVLTVR